MAYHDPVLLRESIQGLQIDPRGTYVDATFGGGGHAGEIIRHLQGGRLYAFDQDQDAGANVALYNEESFSFIPVNFRYMKKYLRLNGVNTVDGILADLGISSHQIDIPERGFSTRHDAELDMRMDRRTALTAKEIINTYHETALQQVLGAYGEVRNAKSLAVALVAARRLSPINTVAELKQVVKPFAPKYRENKYLAQVFQSLRIEVNDELKALEELLLQCEELLKVGGRLVVISYHSLEDRLVKNYMNKGNTSGMVTKDFYGNLLRPFKPMVKKPLIASAGEVAANPRSRSAKLRIAERLPWQRT